MIVQIANFSIRDIGLYKYKNNLTPWLHYIILISAVFRDSNQTLTTSGALEN